MTERDSADPPVDEQHVELVRRYLDAWERGDPELFDQVLSDDFYDVMYGRRRERHELVAQAQGTDLVDRAITIDEAITAGDTVVVRTTGRFTSPVAERRVEVTGMIWVRVAEGRIVTGWGEHDRLGQLQQLGVAPTGERARAWLQEGLRSVRSTVELQDYRYRGARAMVVLHERHMRRFLATWHDARAGEVRLPETANSHYASLETLLRHVLLSARGSMTWMTEQLGLPDPVIEEPPPVDGLPTAAPPYLEHLLERWRTPLVDVPQERFEDRTYTARWGVEYSIDAMLEHAVMHPLRHAFQLDESIASQAR